MWEKAAKRVEKSRGSSEELHAGLVAFPETQTAILAEAADGNWDRFLSEYLAPCWREVILTCRSRHVPLADAQDLFQELVLRVIREGRLTLPFNTTTVGGNRAPVFRGNVPAKFLKYRELTLKSSRFRTVLKGVIRNLLLEYIRERQRKPRRLNVDEIAAQEALVDESVTCSVERQWLAECLVESAVRLHNESETARTRGKRRLFVVLYRSTVLNESANVIAADLGVDRTTVADLVSRARQRFVEHLRETAEIDNVAELKRMLVQAPDLLLRALEQAQALQQCAKEGGSGL